MLFTLNISVSLLSFICNSCETGLNKPSSQDNPSKYYDDEIFAYDDEYIFDPVCRGLYFEKFNCGPCYKRKIPYYEDLGEFYHTYGFKKTLEDLLEKILKLRNTDEYKKIRMSFVEILINFFEEAVNRVLEHEFHIKLDEKIKAKTHKLIDEIVHSIDSQVATQISEKNIEKVSAKGASESDEMIQDERISKFLDDVRAFFNKKSRTRA
ncbi:hypothetical protein H312_01017 [Anncaliia algerae PRA339]|uniref:Uncharacterized protein n=1 Tax=Anncaliia algerae PRA339 TaxID=1288291 RepID=A0A059F3M0_9MICR|nr:hypothetical protein H312_01017 [Anncaliia algerae PRA339]